MSKVSNLNIHCEDCESKGQGVFCHLEGEELKKLDKSKIVNHYKAHQTLFYEGNLPYGLYCVSTGKVKIYKTNADGDQLIVRIAGPGDLLGYRSLIANEPYKASAETIEDSSICFVDKSIFQATMTNHKPTNDLVMKMLAQELGKAEDDRMNFVHKTIRERLAEILLLFRIKYGLESAQGIVLDISLTREEIANLIGSTQESVIRQLSEFKSDGFIQVQGRKITLTNVEALIEAANYPDA